jgi:triphosphoribosyl-dephospho-CoA synthetase
MAAGPRARAVLDAGGVRPSAGREAIATRDRDLLDERKTTHPGATADLTGAAIYVARLEGGWPRARGTSDGRR